MKNANHFTVSFDRLLNHVTNYRHFNTSILYYDEIANWMERANIGPSFMGHDNPETCLENLEETLKN